MHEIKGEVQDIHHLIYLLRKKISLLELKANSWYLKSGIFACGCSMKKKEKNCKERCYMLPDYVACAKRGQFSLLITKSFTLFTLLSS